MAADLPKTYKAVVLEGPKSPFAIKELPLEQPKDGEILIKVLACGVCHSDSALQQGHFGDWAKWPVIPGHETIGNVVAVGPGEKRWKKGDRVGGAWHGGHDGVCKSCNRALFQMCDNAEVNGVNRHGGYAEYATLRSEAAVSVPDDVDPATYAPLLCAGVTVFNSVRRLGIMAGDTVAVQGLGGLGHLALQYCRKMGFRTVALSTSDSKKDMAMKLGANYYVNTSKEDSVKALQALGGAALVIVTAPNPDIMGPLTAACHAGGKLLLLAPVGNVPINSVDLISKGVSVHGWPSGHGLDCEEAIQFAQDHGVNCMVEKFPFSKVEDAVEHMLSGKVRFRSVLVME